MWWSLLDARGVESRRESRWSERVWAPSETLVDEAFVRLECRGQASHALEGDLERGMAPDVEPPVHSTTLDGPGPEDSLPRPDAAS